MSFLFDFLESFKSCDIKSKPMISLVFGVGVMIVGNITTELLSDNLIKIRNKKDVINILGEELSIKSFAKGEIVIAGNIKKISLGGVDDEWNCC